MTTEKLLTEWLEIYQKEHIKARTYSRYQGLISMHIVPTLGERYISEVGRREIQEFLTQQKKDGNTSVLYGSRTSGVVLKQELKRERNIRILLLLSTRI